MKKETFDKKTKAQQRVIIAKDVILRISLGKIKPKTRVFCRLPNIFKGEENYDLKSFVLSKTRSCEACAKGGLFMSFVGINNNFTRQGHYLSSCMDSDSMKALSTIFSKKQLAMIETAFEKTTSFGTSDTSSYEDDKSEAFGAKYDSPKKRLKAIMQNIVKNKGTFKP